ncbi:MAG: bifunctional diaminohydroxyphosphoribosylaminopyrimidine deaminase/5-amino-6-(5-phosphoribosylamino)uracil reductase RibD [Planctomycetota bacterium]|nr:MAG: bifunctional diaminohydroxyphosphoribosylaminopyrimidine deaminase/5-amino-6-(5-phosphoribosylamino)uracil reductase RibD [Planctomycetota bacterium]
MARLSDGDALRMERALFEATRASWLFTAPNPRVGAIAFQGGHRVGTGRHERYGGPHAEEMALREAGAWDEQRQTPRPGVVDEMLVSLEPCSARGPGKRRPPCTELLLAAQLRRIVVAAEDPDPRHRGAGLRALAQAGVEVVLLEGLAARCAAHNGAFLDALAQPERPWILLKWAASFDGKTAGDSGASRWISGPLARDEGHALRACSDALLVGAGTLRRDDPELSARPGGERAQHQPLRVLLDPEGAAPPDARVFQAPGPRLWLLAQGAEPAGPLEQHLEADSDRALYLPRDAEGRLDLAAALAALRRDFGVRRLLVEGGARLQGSLLALGAADAVVRYEAPLLLGGSHGALLGPGFAEPAQAPRLADEERAELGPDLRRAFRIVRR